MNVYIAMAGNRVEVGGSIEAVLTRLLTSSGESELLAKYKLVGTGTYTTVKCFPGGYTVVD